MAILTDHPLIDYLESKNIEFELIHHQPVFTMADIEQKLNIPLQACVKTLVLKLTVQLTSQPILCGISARGRLSFQAVAQHLKTSRSSLTMATPEEAESMIQMPRGAIGLIIPQHQPRTLLSKKFIDQEFLYFGCGRNDQTLKISNTIAHQISQYEFADIE